MGVRFEKLPEGTSRVSFSVLRGKVDGQAWDGHGYGMVRCPTYKRKICKRLCLIRLTHARLLEARGEMRTWLARCTTCPVGMAVAEEFEPKKEEEDKAMEKKTKKRAGPRPSRTCAGCGASKEILAHDLCRTCYNTAHRAGACGRGRMQDVAKAHAEKMVAQGRGRWKPAQDDQTAVDRSGAVSAPPAPAAVVTAGRGRGLKVVRPPVTEGPDGAAQPDAKPAGQAPADAGQALVLTIDLTRRPFVANGLRRLADEQLRTVEDQVVHMLTVHIRQAFTPTVLEKPVTGPLDAMMRAIVGAL